MIPSAPMRWSRLAGTFRGRPGSSSCPAYKGLGRDLVNEVKLRVALRNPPSRCVFIEPGGANINIGHTGAPQPVCSNRRANGMSGLEVRFVVMCKESPLDSLPSAAIGRRAG